MREAGVDHSTRASTEPAHAAVGARMPLPRVMGGDGRGGTPKAVTATATGGMPVLPRQGKNYGKDTRNAELLVGLSFDLLARGGGEGVEGLAEVG